MKVSYLVWPSNGGNGYSSTKATRETKFVLDGTKFLEIFGMASNSWNWSDRPMGGGGNSTKGFPEEKNVPSQAFKLNTRRRNHHHQSVTCIIYHHVDWHEHFPSQDNLYSLYKTSGAYDGFDWHFNWQHGQNCFYDDTGCVIDKSAGRHICTNFLDSTPPPSKGELARCLEFPPSLPSFRLFLSAVHGESWVSNCPGATAPQNDLSVSPVGLRTYTMYVRKERRFSKGAFTLLPIYTEVQTWIWFTFLGTGRRRSVPLAHNTAVSTHSHQVVCYQGGTIQVLYRHYTGTGRYRH